MPDRKAKYILEAEDRTKLALNSAERNLKSFTSGIAKASAALATVGVGLSFAQVIEATARQEAALAQLEARLKSTNGVVGLSMQQIAAFAGEMQNLTTFGDEAVQEMQALLLTFTNIRGGVFQDATRAILDMSVAMGQDLKSSALQVAKALNDPIKGVSALSEVGVAFTASQKETIAALQETGDVAGAQRLILQELSVEFGGAAEAAANTFGGAITQLGNAFGDLLEQKGGLKDAKEAVQDLTKTLQDPAVAQGLNSLIAGAATAASWAARGAAEIAKAMKDFGTQAAQFVSGPGSRLQQLRDQLEFFQGLEGTTWLTRTRLFSNKGFIHTYDDTEIGAEIGRLKGLIQQELGGVQPPVNAADVVPDNPTGAAYSLDVGARRAAVAKKSADDAARAQEQLRKQFDSVNESMVRQLAMLDRTTEYERTLWEVQHGRYRDLTSQQQETLLQVARNIDQRQQQIEATKEAADAAQQLADAEADAGQKAREADVELQRRAQFWRDLVHPANDYYRQLDELHVLLAEGKIDWDTYSEAVLHVQEDIDGLRKTTTDNLSQMNEFTRQAARNMQSELGGTLFDVMQGRMDGMLLRWKQVLDRMVAEAAAAELAKALVGDYATTGQLGGWIGLAAQAFAGVYHGGGVVGAGGQQRMVPALAFAGAPRYHAGGIAGLAPNETPAILKQGEEVLRANDPRHVANGGGSSSGVRIVNVIDPAMAGEYMQSAAGERLILNTLQRNAGAVKELLI